MTRKDYVLLSKAIHTVFRECQSDGERLTVSAVAKEIAMACKQDNSAFKYDRFMRACGVLADL